LAERRAQAYREAVCIYSHIALGDRTAEISVEKLDRVLDRHHVLVQSPVDVVHHCRHGRALPAAADATHQHQAALRLGDLLQDIGQAQGLDGGHRKWNDPHNDHERRTLTQHIDPEPPDSRHSPGTVEVADSLDPGPIFLTAHQFQRDRLGLVRGQPLLGERDQFAIDPGTKNIARLDVQVGGPTLYRSLDDLFQRVRRGKG